MRQSGGAIELRWSRPRARVDGEPIEGPLTYRVLARSLERTPIPVLATTPAGAPPSATVSPGAAGVTGVTGQAGATGPAAAGPPGTGPLVRAAEEAFLRDSEAVAEITETPEQAAASAPYAVLLGPERFPGTRFTSVRLAFAVIARDARGRRSRARAIVEIDPVEPLLPPTDLRATGTPEGVALAWRLPESPATGEGSAVPSETSGVNVYRAEAVSPAGPPRFPYRPVAGSPYVGESALDRTAAIGTSYLYEARRVSRAPGKGLRESVSSGTAAIAFSDLFPPGPPGLVTALPAVDGGAPAVRVAWSSPIDADVAGYRIYRSEGGGGFILAVTVPAALTEWTDSDVKRGTTYRYTVATIDAAVPPNESARSEEVEAILPAEGA